MCSAMAKKSFTEDYKKEIVRLVTELGKKPDKVAEDIGVTGTTVRRWVKQYSLHGEGAFPGKGNLRPEDAKQKALEKENRELKQEVEILKKAMGIFSRGER